MIAAFGRLRRKKLFRAGVWYVLGNLTQRGIAFAALPLFANLLLPEQMGVIAVWQGWVSILSVVLTLNVSVSVTNAALDFKDDAYWEFLSSITLAAALTVLVGALVLGLLPVNVHSSVFGLTPPLLFLAAIAGGAHGIIQIRQLVHRYRYEYARYNLLSIGGQIGAVVLGLLLIVFAPCIWPRFDTTLGQPLGTILTFVVIALLLIYSTLRGARKWFRPAYLRYALVMSLPLILHTIAHTLLSRADTYLITQLVGERETGIYSVAYRFGEIILVVWAGTTNVWTVWFFERMKEGNREAIISRARQYLVMFAAITLGLMIAAPIALRLLTPAPYWEAIKLVPIVMSAGFFGMIYGFYVPVEFYYRRTRVTGVITLIAAAVNISLNLLLLPWLGYEVAAFTSVLAYAVMFVGHAYYVEHRLEAHGLFDFRLLIASALTITASGIVMGALMNKLLVG